MAKTPKELGMLFLEHFPPDENGCTDLISMEILLKISPNFKTNNGCQWARDNVSWLGRRYKIRRVITGRSVSAVQLVGFNEKTSNHNIPSVAQSLKNERCVILDVGTNIEIDHKNGRYNSEEYQIEDFQPLCKTANDAKRQHCKECQVKNRRYDATILGYKVPFIKGDFDSDYCEGCYWYDPIAFNKKISENYNV